MFCCEDRELLKTSSTDGEVPTTSSAAESFPGRMGADVAVSDVAVSMDQFSPSRSCNRTSPEKATYPMDDVELELRRTATQVARSLSGAIFADGADFKVRSRRSAFALGEERVAHRACLTELPRNLASIDLLRPVG